MKKDVFFFVGVGALILSIAAAATWWFQRNQDVPQQIAQSVVERADAPSIGPVMAKVRVVEFLDPECEACRAIHPIVKKLLAEFKDQVFYQIRYMPFHGNSKRAASLLEAARQQNKYWEALDQLFLYQPDWGDHHQPRPELMPKLLGEIGLDIVLLEADAQNPEIAQDIEQDQRDGASLGVSRTPTFFVNGKILRELSESALRNAISAEL